MISQSKSIFMAYPYHYHYRRRRSKRGFSDTRFFILMLSMVVGMFMLFAYNMEERTSDHGRRLIEDNSYDHHLSCLPCHCDCSSETNKTMLTVDLDCGKEDPEMKEEMGKNISSLLREEIDLLKIVSEDNLRRMEALTMDVKKTSSHYQKEAEKCNVGMETCEGAREMAQAEFMEELKITKMWQSRAIQLGWEESS